MRAMIAKKDLILGETYLLNARNLTKGLWTGKAFVGQRTKFGATFKDEEMHWEDGPPHGTAKPLEIAPFEED